jgi:hypothetical protein
MAMRLPLPHENLSPPSWTIRRSAASRDSRPLPFGKGVNEDEPVMEAHRDFISGEGLMFRPTSERTSPRKLLELHAYLPVIRPDAALRFLRKTARPFPDIAERAFVEMT